MSGTKAKSVQIFEIRLWSKKHYKLKLNKTTNIYDGAITDKKTKEVIWIDSAGDLLSAIEKLYRKAEKKL